MVWIVDENDAAVVVRCWATEEDAQALASIPQVADEVRRRDR